MIHVGITIMVYFFLPSYSAFIQALPSANTTSCEGVMCHALKRREEHEVSKAGRAMDIVVCSVVVQLMFISL